jgi:hypothetical protein
MLDCSRYYENAAIKEEEEAQKKEAIVDDARRC